METVRLQENVQEDFPTTMGVNAFRGFLNEFMGKSRLEQEKPRKTKRKKEKKRKVDEPVRFAGHNFVLTIINIPTVCEICSSFFMWPIEKGLVCQNCKVTCHKKCHTKVLACSKEVVVARHVPHPIFGVPLQQLTSGEEKVPVIVDRLITTIEMYGLYTEGIYRKSGNRSPRRREPDGAERLGHRLRALHPADQQNRASSGLPGRHQPANVLHRDHHHGTVEQSEIDAGRYRHFGHRLSHCDEQAINHQELQDSQPNLPKPMPASSLSDMISQAVPMFPLIGLPRIPNSTTKLSAFCMNITII
ncbi:unnamed protein product [Nesidiocoris tenuis]|uniref:Phorbol-ester/DAG-type domain-containing protein n=1 Tax=Nesidiocoris tenuis TaxID=355587 RepID=A0A6H5FYI6_9HEMI|nr:unnamed protein product [Nesidiocoris tenuis]